MSHVNSLGMTIDATHRSLEERYQHAAVMASSPGKPRKSYQHTDSFMAATSRHLAAVEAVLLPLAGHRLVDGHARVHEYLHAAHRLELALAHTKAKLYGEAHAVHTPWPEIWAAVRDSLDSHNTLERALVTDLVEVLPTDDWDDVARQVYVSETKAPTRPHPYTPHTGVAGRLARRVWSLADRFWDTAEGRVIPEPVRPVTHEHDHDSLMAQYLLGEPRFDPDATLIEHRHPKPSHKAGSA